MIEKLKALGDACKNLVLWLIAPLITLAIMIFYLISKNRSLQQEVSTLQSSQQVTKDEGVMNEQDQKTALSLDNYRKLRAEWLASRTKKPS